MKVLKTFDDGSVLAHDRGQFDNYRVSFYDAKGNYLSSPRDTYFFDFLLSLNDNHTVWKIVKNLADQISEKPDFQKLYIKTISNSLYEQKVFSALAAAMLAEEKKANTRLGCRVKLLGIYQVLFCGIEPRIAANWSKGKGWREIERECEKYGF